MSAYIYNADLYCAACGDHLIESHIASGAEDTGDSDDFPQGPYPDGGGEADCPQHCAACGVFLENPLTEQGAQDVQELITEHLQSGRGTKHTLQTWSHFYGLPWRTA